MSETREAFTHYDTEGRPKAGYPDRKRARQVARLRERANRTPLRVYACPACGSYHLTKAVPR